MLEAKEKELMLLQKEIDILISQKNEAIKQYGIKYDEIDKEYNVLLAKRDEVIKEVKNFHKNGFHLDFIGLEPGWMNMSYPCSYEWDEGRFPSL